MKAEEILDFIRGAGRPVSFREIADNFSLKSSARKKVKKLLRELTEEGKILITRKGLYIPLKEAKLISGYFEAHKEGYGFVIPDSPKERDIFIPPHATAGAMNGDRVVVRLEQRAKREGRVIRILERATKRVVGTVDRVGPIFYLQPRKKAGTQQIVLTQEGRAPKVGDLVLAEIVSYQRGDNPLVAKLVKILEKPKSPKEDIDILIYEYDLPRKFSSAAIEDAKKVLKRGITKRDYRDRVDLRELRTVTIDGESAKDFDDAVSIRKNKKGFILWVHIADVSHYVKWDSPIDLEASNRATSVYFPDRVIPMLPPELSENICSLLPKTPRLTFTVEIHFSNSGDVREAKFYPSVIKTQERMTYTSVKRILIDRDREEIERYGDLVEDFENMAELCEILKSKRIRRGSLDFDLPEPEILLDIKGDPQSIVRAERNLAHFIIEEFMIAANEAVAEFLHSQGIPSLYRVHEEPEHNKIQSIARIIRNLGVIKGELKPKEFSDLINLIKGTDYEEIVNYLILRSLKQARYSPENVGHFGLASSCYTHFTSPIRRYPDLVVHRILKEYLKRGKLSKQKIKLLEQRLPEIAVHSSKMERRADSVERDSLQIMRVWFMKDRVGEEFTGKVTMVTPEGLRVRLDEFYVEGFLHLSHMTDDFYQFDEKRYSIVGLRRKRRFTIGTPVRVIVSKVNLEDREILFDLL